MGRRLADAMGDRNQFDRLLQQCESFSVADLKEAFEGMIGHPPWVNGKAGILKAMKNWQREHELNDSLHKAQEKHKP